VSILLSQLHAVAFTIGAMADKLKKFGMKAQAKGAMLSAQVKGKMKKDKTTPSEATDEATDGVPEMNSAPSGADEEEHFEDANDCSQPDR
jgi:hypothetical protein